MTQKILAFAGSLRRGSFNKKLVRIAADGARAAGAEVTEIDLRDIPMPLFDGDIEREQGLPPNAKLFKRALIESQGMIISSPEYNSAIPAVLKNAIDWASRAESNEGRTDCIQGQDRRPHGGVSRQSRRRARSGGAEGHPFQHRRDRASDPTGDCPCERSIRRGRQPQGCAPEGHDPFHRCAKWCHSRKSWAGKGGSGPQVDAERRDLFPIWLPAGSRPSLHCRKLR